MGALNILFYQLHRQSKYQFVLANLPWKAILKSFHRFALKLPISMENDSGANVL